MTPDWTEKVKSALRKEEGFSQFLYKDNEGYNSIGYGFNLDTVGMYENEAEFILDNRLKLIVAKLFFHFPFFDELNEARQFVLADMGYNLGIEKLLTFHNLLFALQEYNYVNAAQEMLDSKWAQQVGERAVKLADIMRTGEL